MTERFVWRGGQFVDPRTNAPMPMPERDGLCCPMVQSDIPEYRSPIDGKLITSRTHRRYDLESNNCVAAEPKRRGYKNPHFALKRGLPLNEQVKDKLHAKC
jgi:hypothetical protein